MDPAKTYTCPICGHTAAQSPSAPLQCLHCGSLGFLSLFFAPRFVPRPVRPPGHWQPAHRAPDEAPK